MNDQAIAEELGRRVRAARAYADLSSEKLAASLGIHPTTLSNYEDGSIPPSKVEWLIRSVAAATGMPENFLRAEGEVLVRKAARRQVD